MKKQKIVVTFILLVLSFIVMPVSSVFAVEDPSTSNSSDIVDIAVSKVRAVNFRMFTALILRIKLYHWLNMKL